MKKNWILIPTILTGIVPMLSTVACAKTDKYAYDTIKATYLENMLKTLPTKEFDGKTVEEIVQHLTPIRIKGVLDKEYETYRFSQLDYDSQDTATWPKQTHIEWTLQIALIAQKTNNIEMMDIAIKLTYYWIANEFKNDNWWFNVIGVPRDFSNVALILYDRLSPRGQERLLEIMRRGSLHYNKDLDPKTKTGANLIWYGDITLKCALIAHDEAEMDTMLDLVLAEIKEDANEGFQKDGTFFQHGREIYNGGYGRQGATNLTKIISAFAGSGIEFPKEKLDILSRFIINGVAPFVHKGQYDYLVMGRALSRKNAAYVDGRDTDLGNVYDFKSLTELADFPNKEKVHAIMGKIERGESSFTGIKCYPQSSTIVMNVDDDIHMSFKGIDRTLVNSEEANNENILGHNFSYGANTCVMETGREYENISPNWDYAQLPGTSAINEEDADLIKYNDHDFKPHEDFAGPFFCGEKDGIGFCMQRAYHGYRSGSEKEGELPEDKVTYTITCFATEYGMVILGSNIEFIPKSGSGTKEITTTAEQCVQTGGVDGIGENQPEVRHGHVYYKGLGNTTLNAKVENRKGSWNRNKSSYDSYDRSIQDILTITVNRVGDSYAYSIQTESKKDKVFKLVCNTNKIQAIELPSVDKEIAVACYEPGEFQYEGDTYNITQVGYQVIEKKRH